MAVELKYNDIMERWDVELPYELGDLKDRVCVASIEDDTITFWKPLNVSDVRSIMLTWEEFKFQLDRNPLEDLKEKEFEPYPDGDENE